MPTTISYEPRYEVRLVTPYGVYIDILDDYANLDYTLVTNDIGTCSIELPSTYPITRLAKDYRIEIWRSVGFGAPKLEGNTQFLIQNREVTTNDSGSKTVKVSGLSLNHILKRRIIAYKSTDLTYVDVADFADDMMKDIVRTNFSSAAVDTARQIDSTYFSVDVDKSLGPTVWKTFPHKNVLDVIKEIADTSYTLGTPLFFDIIVDTPPLKHKFSTWITARGVDRRNGTANPLILGYAQGSIGANSIVTDWSNEIGYVYAAGPGEDDVRNMQVASDSTIINSSPYGRSELWVDSQDNSTDNNLLSEAKSHLTANRNRKVFTGKLINTATATYGVHWNWGDYLTVDTGDDLFDCFVSGVHVTVSGPDGKEVIDAALRSD